MQDDCAVAILRISIASASYSCIHHCCYSPTVMLSRSRSRSESELFAGVGVGVGVGVVNLATPGVGVGVVKLATPGVGVGVGVLSGTRSRSRSRSRNFFNRLRIPGYNLV